MMGKPVRRAAASSSASRTGRGGTRASRYAATRGPTRFILSLPCQSAINRQVPQRGRLLPRLLVQPRQVEVRVRQPAIGGDRLLVRLHRVVGTPPVLQRDAKVVPRGRVVGMIGQHRPEMRLRLLGAAAFFPACSYNRARLKYASASRRSAAIACSYAFTASWGRRRSSSAMPRLYHAVAWSG